MKEIKDKMLNVRVNGELQKKFKMAVLINDTTISRAIVEIIERYVEETMGGKN